MELRLLRETGNTTRIGVVVPRHDHTAVARNLVKRRIRELVRETVEAAPQFSDAIIFAGPRAYRASFDALRQDLGSLWRRAIR
jgi:ribonuclease P protein component